MKEAVYSIKFFRLVDGILTGPSQGYKYTEPSSFGEFGRWHTMGKNDEDPGIRTCLKGFHVPLLESIEYWKNNYYYEADKMPIKAYIVQLGGFCSYDIYPPFRGKIACQRIRLIRELKGFSLCKAAINYLNKEYNLISGKLISECIAKYGGFDYIDYKEVK